MLIVFYSRSGNTRQVADYIHETIGGDSVELQPVEPYPADYSAVTKQAKRELESGYKPALKTRIEDIGSYRVVFLGSPNWWGTIASPVRTFLSEYDMTGKIIAPFITHEGSGLGRSAADIASLCKNATVLESLAVRGCNAATAKHDVTQWLRRIGLSA